MISASLSRRKFLEFLGAATATQAVAKDHKRQTPRPAKLPVALPASRADELALTSGLKFDIIVKYGDPINRAGDLFGFNPDFTSFMPLSPTEAFLFVNHEYFHSLFVCGLPYGAKLTKEAAEKMLSVVGCSVLKIRRKDLKSAWNLDINDPLNRRISGLTPIPMVAPREVAGKLTVMGTVNNCSGGQTPWRTFLTCEENFDWVWGSEDSQEIPNADARPFYPDAKSEHYGWVVEVDPFTGNARKLTGLGRFAHEGARVTSTHDGRPVVYMADDTADQCIYKFIGDTPGSLVSGTLYVANTQAGRWIALDREQNPKLKEAFVDQLDLLIHTRKAAKIVGGTPHDRPEGIDIHPVSGAVVISLTNNKARNNLYGSLIKIEEKDADHGALVFKASTLLMGGSGAGIACPDNIRFDHRGNLWVTSDMSDSAMRSEPYREFGNNSLFFVPMDGVSAGQPIRVASSPVDAEFTGPCFADDGRTLFVSVQHPGEGTTDLQNPTSRWPSGGNELPKPAVVALHGELLETWTALS